MQLESSSSVHDHTTDNNLDVAGLKPPTTAKQMPWELECPENGVI